MVTLIKYTLAAALAVGAASASLHDSHLRHARGHARHQVQKRETDNVKDVDAPFVVVYELAGKLLNADEAKEGLNRGDFVVIGETTPTPVPAKPSSKDLKAQFIESKASTSDSSTTSTTSPPTSSSSSASSTSTSTSMSTSMSTSTPPPTTTSSDPTSTSAPPTSSKTAAPSKAASAAKGAVASPSGAGLTSEFPSGKVPCSEFPSAWGAVPVDHLGFGGFSGLQFVPGYTIGAQSISEIITGISGQNCAPGCMCSYACPVGYQKTQWPAAQGATRQSIGGLYCNSDGFLELTRGSITKMLCDPGEGGVTIQNDLDELVSTCRTDYPGSEAMVVPAIAGPGSTIPLCNPSQTAFEWDHKDTSAQYYVNPKGVPAEDACVWDSDTDHDSRGNWSPIIIGVGKAADGNTYMSIFRNLPTSTAVLDFNIEITGDVNAECSYINDKFSGGGTGCTTAMPSGGKAVIRYF